MEKGCHPSHKKRRILQGKDGRRGPSAHLRLAEVVDWDVCYAAEFAADRISSKTISSGVQVEDDPLARVAIAA